jgi:hypothetical protein
MFVPVTDWLGETITENSALYTPHPAMSLMNDIRSRDDRARAVRC